ncbi:hypothetical protein [Parasporobacterium paucivorans]|uniref:Uracil DNA glycosylase superfamily protein n=1 Tax=Parasporobacterium paucivorans DSM 15970 TaxID=1122934 RepID=A0A1M6J030_9FIRM|nr:hypothetical protein [Parasporobacterium paucivorans]SHJ40053.1 hypothetical protein SAMN02745691_01883 [Parasporobacterium paucivorans DSM 15970]
MSINEKEEELFDRWQTESNYKPFIKDGIVEETEWNKQKIKICYVLKDTDRLDGHADNDLRKFLREGGSSTYWKTWNNIVRYTKALLEDEEEYPKTISKACKLEYLPKICAINLKKQDGKSSADKAEIAAFVMQDAEFIQEQLNLYQPDVIVCCGRGEGKNADLLYEHVLDRDKTSGWQMNEKAIKGIENEKAVDINYYYTRFGGKETPVISFLHPQKTKGTHSLFADWYETMRKVKKELNIY